MKRTVRNRITIVFAVVIFIFPPFYSEILCNTGIILLPVQLLQRALPLLLPSSHLPPSPEGS